MGPPPSRRSHLVLATDTLDPDGTELAHYYRAECLRNLGHGPESLAAMRHLDRPGSRLAEAAVKGICQMQRRLGHFRELEHTVRRHPDDAVRHRLEAELFWAEIQHSQRGMVTWPVSRSSASPLGPGRALLAGA